MGDVFQVSTATASSESARALLRGAVEMRLAAGGQVLGPVDTAFWHEGTFGTGLEWQVLLKTTAALYPRLEAYLRGHHEWSNPEIVAVPVAAGSDDYLAWVARCVADPE
jgi:periplasmic divalent cation tolerance protein